MKLTHKPAPFFSSFGHVPRVTLAALTAACLTTTAPRAYAGAAFNYEFSPNAAIIFVTFAGGTDADQLSGTFAFSPVTGAVVSSSIFISCPPVSEFGPISDPYCPSIPALFDVSSSSPEQMVLTDDATGSTISLNFETSLAADAADFLSQTPDTQILNGVNFRFEQGAEGFADPIGVLPEPSSIAVLGSALVLFGMSLSGRRMIRHRRTGS